MYLLLFFRLFEKWGYLDLLNVFGTFLMLIRYVFSCWRNESQKYCQEGRVGSGAVNFCPLTFFSFSHKILLQLFCYNRSALTLLSTTFFNFLTFTLPYYRTLRSSTENVVIFDSNFFFVCNFLPLLISLRLPCLFSSLLSSISLRCIRYVAYFSLSSLFFRALCGGIVTKKV